MQRAKLRKKKVKGNFYWYTEANGEAYFGRVGDVTWEAANEDFRKHLGRKQEAARPEALTVAALLSKFLGWVQENRSDAQYRRRKKDCTRFARYEYEGRRLADLPATEVTGLMLEGWRANLAATPVAGASTENDNQKRGLERQSLLHAETSVRHAFSWGGKHNSPNTLIPVTFRPFAGVERTWVPPKGLTEEHLLTVEEVDALLSAAKYDVDQFRRWGIETHIKKHGATGMRPAKDDFPDLLRVYHATGARTGELLRATVADFLPKSSQIVLRFHKTARSKTVSVVRSITLNDEAAAILRRRCAGRQPTENIFTTAWKKPWNKKTVNRRLASVRRIAAALGATITGEVTIYDFRHLWISDALESSLGIETVAKMAGTSVAMVEKVYGHFRKDRFAAAHQMIDAARKERRAAKKT
ncbi:MAG TPA: tyrosine-type recombinase/integrase [Gemmata sp.]